MASRGADIGQYVHNEQVHAGTPASQNYRNRKIEALKSLSRDFFLAIDAITDALDSAEESSFEPSNKRRNELLQGIFTAIDRARGYADEGARLKLVRQDENLRKMGEEFERFGTELKRFRRDILRGHTGGFFSRTDMSKKLAITMWERILEAGYLNRMGVTLKQYGAHPGV